MGKQMNRINRAGARGFWPRTGLLVYCFLMVSLGAAIAAQATISGRITCNGAGLPGVLLSGLTGGPLTDSQGYYSSQVTVPWSGTVTPVLTGYTFNPLKRTYTNIYSDQLNQIYTASSSGGTYYTIAGTVTANGKGLANVILSGLPGSPKTNAAGQYSASVQSGWSGTATPALSGYTFSPQKRTYNNVTGNLTADDYTAAQGSVKYSISGRITLSGSGMDGATLSGLPGSPMTDSQGEYSAQVDAGWSGTVTPVATGYIFTPSSRSYSDVQSNQANQNYTAEASGSATFTISGKVSHGSVGLAGVLMNGLPGNPATNSQGDYSAMVPGGWRGTVKPFLIGFAFSPAAMSYRGVEANMVTNYMAFLATRRVRFSSGIGGSLSGALDQSIPNGGSTSPVQAFPDENYIFLSWTGSDGFYRKTNPLVISMVDRDLDVRANFSAWLGGEPPLEAGVRIINPENGEKVNGILMAAIEVPDDLNPRRAEFYVDGNRRADIGTVPSIQAQVTGIQLVDPLTITETRYYYEWNTRQEPFGWHQVKGIVYLDEGIALDEVTVLVSNVDLVMQVERQEDRALRLRRDFGRLDIQMMNPWNMTIAKIVISRAEDPGQFKPLKELLPADFQNGQYTYFDTFIAHDKRFRYKAEAFDERGVLVGATDETTI